MAVTAQIQFKQGATTFTAGQAATGQQGVAVTVQNALNANVVKWTFTVIDVPPGSAVPVGQVQTGTTPTWTFTPDHTDEFLIRLDVFDNQNNQSTDFRIFGVTRVNTRRIPSFTATNLTSNFGGNARGWSPEMEGWLNAVDAVDVPSIAALRTLFPYATFINVLGYYSIGDGGGGIYWWDPAATATDDGGSVIQTSAITGAGRFRAVLNGAPFNPKRFGARGNGIETRTASITVNTATVTDTSAPFTSTTVDGGKLFVLDGAGTGGLPLVGTILTVTDSQHAVLSTNAIATVTNKRWMFGNDDTAAIDAAIAAAVSTATNAAREPRVLFPPGLYMRTTTINLTAAHNGIVLEGTMVQSYSGAAIGSKIALAAAQTFLLHVSTVNHQINKLWFHGNHLANDTTRISYLTTLSKWSFVTVTHAVPNGLAAAGAGNLLLFSPDNGVLEIDLLNFERCVFFQDPNDTTDYAVTTVWNNNSNAFQIDFTNCLFSNAANVIRYSSGSCNIRKSQTFRGLNAIFSLDAAVQAFVLDDVYNELSSGVPFINVTGIAAVSAQYPITIKNCTVNSPNSSINWLHLQPLTLIGCTFGFNFGCTPMGLGVWAASTVFAANAIIVPTTNNPSGWAFQVSAGGGGASGATQPTWSTTAPNVGQTVTDGALTWTNIGTPGQTQFGQYRVASIQTSFGTGKGFTGPGAATMVDEQGSVYGTASPNNLGNRLATPLLARTNTGYDNTGITLVGTVNAGITTQSIAADVHHIGTLTANRTYTIGTPLRPNQRMLVSRAGAGDGFTVTLNPTVGVSVALGAGQWVEYVYDNNQGWTPLSFGSAGSDLPNVYVTGPATVTATAGARYVCNANPGNITINLPNLTLNQTVEVFQDPSTTFNGHTITINAGSNQSLNRPAPNQALFVPSCTDLTAVGMALRWINAGSALLAGKTPLLLD